MDRRAELLSMWELPATWKLISLFSRVLSFSVPTPSQFEDALLNPREHMTMIANIHGRLLRLSAGASSAKNWMTYTFRFVRHRPDDFHFIPTEQELAAPVLKESADAEMKDVGADAVEESAHDGENDDGALDQTQVESRPFPTEEETYFRFSPSTRLLVLHTVAEIVLADHETLLHAGSITDFDIFELRQHPVGSDAVGNNYWYFGDCERVYREPGKKLQKTRRQQADESAKAAKEIAKAAAQRAAKLVREEKRKEAERKREEVRLRREERKRKSIEKWGPRVAVARKTRASSRAESAVMKESGGASSAASAGSSARRKTRPTEDDNSELDEKHDGEGHSDTDSIPQERGSHRAHPERRTSGRRRKATQSEPVDAPVRTKKRPRRNDVFDDLDLRVCNKWELISTGSSELEQLIDRFRSEKGGVLPSEKALVRFLEDDLMPEVLERDEKIRKEQERVERKMRHEALFSVQKRSSRVQALEEKREKEARRVAEEEEREQAHLQEIAVRAEALRSQVVSLEKEQSRSIRISRRAHGWTDAIDRDDRLRHKMDREAITREAIFIPGPVRRSTRTLRTSRRGLDSTTSPSPTVEDTKVAQNVLAEKMPESDPHHSKDETPQQLPGASNGNDALLKDNEGYTDNTPNHAEAGGPKQVIHEGQENRSHQRANTTIEEVRQGGEAVESASKQGDASLKTSEQGVEDVYTWSINPDDKEPIRVLDKFFFALKADFADAPLEACETSASPILGFGVLLPPLKSAANARLVTIDEVIDWSIEYGIEPKLWVKSKYAWYELREASTEYREAFTSTRRKYELCIRIAILGATYKSAELTYGHAVNLLSYRYEEMQPYATIDILKEKRFIVAQMESLGRRPVLQSGFVRELKRKIRAEDLQIQAALRKSKAALAVDSDQKATTGDSAKPSKAQTETEPKKSAKPKRRLSSGKPIPRAVSTILSGLLRAATKSKTRSRKPKPKVGLAKEKAGRTDDKTARAAKPNGTSKALSAGTSETKTFQTSKHSEVHVSGNSSLPVTRNIEMKDIQEANTILNFANGHKVESSPTSQLQLQPTARAEAHISVPGTHPVSTGQKSTKSEPPNKTLSLGQDMKRAEQSSTSKNEVHVPSETSALVAQRKVWDSKNVASINSQTMAHMSKHANENGLHHGVQNGMAEHSGRHAD